jgi:hypothetical protein
MSIVVPSIKVLPMIEVSFAKLLSDTENGALVVVVVVGFFVVVVVVLVVVGFFVVVVVVLVVVGFFVVVVVVLIVVVVADTIGYQASEATLHILPSLRAKYM